MAARGAEEAKEAKEEEKKENLFVSFKPPSGGGQKCATSAGRPANLAIYLIFRLLALALSLAPFAGPRAPSCDKSRGGRRGSKREKEDDV